MSQQTGLASPAEILLSSWFLKGVSDFIFLKYGDHKYLLCSQSHFLVDTDMGSYLMGIKPMSKSKGWVLHLLCIAIEETSSYGILISFVFLLSWLLKSQKPRRTLKPVTCSAYCTRHLSRTVTTKGRWEPAHHRGIQAHSYCLLLPLFLSLHYTFLFSERNTEKLCFCKSQRSATLSIFPHSCFS